MLLFPNENVLVLQDLSRNNSYTLFPSDAPIIIGRDSSCGLFLCNDSFISRIHAQIYLSGTDCYIKDMESTNGTYVDGQKIREPARLREGMEIQVGSVRLKVVQCRINDPENRAGQPVDVRTRQYLTSMGLEEKAGKDFVVRIQLKGSLKVFRISLHGWQNERDAINYLRENGSLSPDKLYRFANWPHADSMFGPGHNHVSACVCELPKRTMILEEFEPTDPSFYTVLYGCPNIKGLEKTALTQKTEVISYDGGRA